MAVPRHILKTGGRFMRAGSQQLGGSRGGRIIRPFSTSNASRDSATSNGNATTTEQSRADRETHFGFQTVTEAEKTQRVAGVFSSVAETYDRMNDLMSFGWHRVWK